jgi:endoglucanase
VLGYAYEFFDANQAGDRSLGLPSWNRLLYTRAAPGGWKKPGHLSDGGSGRDLSGGYYDAGDYLKCPHALAWGVSNLIMSLLEFRPAYDASGNYAIAVNHVRWALDWLLKAHVRAGPAAADNAFVGQVRRRACLRVPPTNHARNRLPCGPCAVAAVAAHDRRSLTTTTTSTLDARSTPPTPARSTWPTGRARAPTWLAR